jgi:hypothetical protein
MTDPATLLNLADRCEQAAGPDRELDGAAWCAVNGYSFVKWDGAGVVWRKADGGIRHYPASRVPYYTASLDAAVTLYPVLPKVIPSCPRKASAAALRARAAMIQHS